MSRFVSIRLRALCTWPLASTRDRRSFLSCLLSEKSYAFSGPTQLLFLSRYDYGIVHVFLLATLFSFPSYCTITDLCQQQLDYSSGMLYHFYLPL